MRLRRVADLDPGPAGSKRQAITLDRSDWTSDAQPAVRDLLSVADGVLWSWKILPNDLPESVTSADNGARFLRVEDLFVQPDFDELTAVARTVHGEEKKLSPEQLASIADQGNFEVSSVNFPGMNHVWVLSHLLVKGKSNSEETFRQEMAKAIQIMYSTARNRIDGGLFSLTESLSAWKQSLKNVADILIGIPVLKKMDVYSRLDHERERHLVAELVCSTSSLYDDLIQHMASVLNSHGQDIRALSLNVPEIPRHFESPSEQAIDLSLYNSELISAAKPHLLHILNSILKEWFADRRRELLQQFKEDGVAEDEAVERASRVLFEEYVEKVCSSIMQSTALQSFGSSIPELFVSHLKASIVTQKVLHEFEDDIENEVQAVDLKLKGRHPILYKVPEWRRRHLEAAKRQYARQNQWQPHLQAISAARGQRLQQFEYFLDRDLKFLRDIEPVLKKELDRVKVPSQNFEFRFRIWNPTYWVVTKKLANGSLEVVATEIIDSVGNTSSFHGSQYVVEKYQSMKTCSKYPFWRWQNFALRTCSWIWNALFVLGLAIPWCSPVSLQAVFRQDAYFPDYNIDQESGQLRRDPSSRVPTIRSRFSQLWTHIRSSRGEFEGQAGTGLLPRSLTRFFNIVFNFAVKGALGTLLICVILPVAFVVISISSLLLAVLSPFAVAAVSVIFHVLAILFFDFEGASCLNALLPNLVIFIATGVLQPIAAVLVACVLCPLVSLLIASWAYARKWTRNAWDAFALHVLLKRLGRVPDHDSFLARRISGPGLASMHLFQVKPEQALAALEIKLELVELEVYKNEMKGYILEPLKQYELFSTMYLGPFGVELSSNNRTTYSLLVKESDTMMTELEKKVAERQKALCANIDEVPLAKVRLLESDLGTVLAYSTKLVRDFFPSRVFSRMSKEEKMAFWEQKSLSVDDWPGLSSALLADFFSQGFLVPLQATDQYFSLQVQHWNLSDFTNMIVRSSLYDNLSLVRHVINEGSARRVRTPEIPVEFFNPTDEGRRASARSRSDKNCLVKLSSPLPVPSPLIVVLVIHDRDSSSPILRDDVRDQLRSMVERQPLLRRQSDTGDEEESGALMASYQN